MPNMAMDDERRSLPITPSVSGKRGTGPFAKAYSGLNDAEIRQIDRFVRSHTIEKFGPVHRVTPELVMELAFENIQLSSRHKCGLAVRFPRILRWRHDKRPEDANRLDDLKRMVVHLP